MPYRICKILEIETAHILSKHPDHCKFPHGHSRKIEFVLESDQLDESEMVCDFKIIKSTMQALMRRFDHAMCVNSKDKNFGVFKAIYGDHVVHFDSEDPTTEVMARVIFNHFKEQLRKYVEQPAVGYPLRNIVRIVKVRVWETSSSWAEYSER